MNKPSRPPHPEGIRVAVIRHEHGWEDGGLEGTITARYQRPSGSWGYEVTSDEGGVFEINSTKDIVPV